MYNTLLKTDFLCNLLFCLSILEFLYGKITHDTNWAAAQQNQQNDLYAQQRHRH